MAGDWIKMRITLADEPEVIGISTETGLDEDTVVGKLHRLWGWADQKTTDGHANSVTKAWLDRYVRHDGFADAMQKVGWLEVIEPCEEYKNGAIVLPKFEVHNTKTGKQRALAANRAAKKRHANRHAPSVTKSAPTEEKRREDIPITNVIGREHWPGELQNDEFEAAWAEWNSYRREARIKKYTSTGAKKQLKALAEIGPQRAIAAINYSIRQGWSGIYEEKIRGSPGKNPQSIDENAYKKFLERHPE